MKKLLMVIAVSVFMVFAASSTFAAQKAQKGSTGQARKNTGCGLGTMLFENSADNSTLLQSLQATTNGSFGAQTFGITSGTSECDQPAKFANNDRLNQFMVANMDNLAKEIAMGKGETLEAFAELLQVPVEKRAEFYEKLQENFARIFTSESVQLATVVDNVVTVSSN